jgi:hypothetical protein
MTKHDESKHPYNEAGRRLKAALISYQMGYSGVDDTLKQMPQVAELIWCERAESLLIEMAGQVASRLLAKDTPGIH